MYGINANCSKQPENIKFEYDDTTADAELKILDFGFARYINQNEILQNQVGTICYEGTNKRFQSLFRINSSLAPEILKGERQSFPVDVWAVGIIAYTLYVIRPPLHYLANNIFRICGFPPFFSSSDRENDSESLERYRRFRNLSQVFTIV